jgi:membrane protein implicated in regulation of membrane protease activity
MHPSFLWLIGGTGLCLMEFMLPSALVSVFLGLAAIGVSLFALFFPSALAGQVFVWMLLSAAIAWLGHRYRPKQSSIDFSQTEAQALTAIAPGRTGRVLYEGASWRAKCGDDTSTMQPEEQLQVIGRDGTTLLVVPIYRLEDH